MRQKLANLTKLGKGKWLALGLFRGLESHSGYHIGIWLKWRTSTRTQQKPFLLRIGENFLASAAADACAFSQRRANDF